MTDEPRAQLVAANEAVDRRINEAIEQGRWPGEDGALAFRCECARARCTEMLRLTHEQYERVRANPRRFALVPGHQDPANEDVVETHPDHIVVEKRGEAGRIATASDPRS
jgi:hypothetical protein